ncbi:MAG: ParA family protein [Taibaiella sp.]|nr:ParA family protein [Taibaiella sp.]
MFIASLYNLKGGVGKTSACVNFAFMAAKDGYRTLLWDIDPQGAASFYYKSQPRTKSSIKKIMEQSISLDEAIMSTGYPNLDIIPADISARKLEHMLGHGSSKKQISSLLKTLEDEYDFIFIDCPPGFSLVADNIFYASDVVLMPVIPSTLSIRSYELVKDYFADKEIDLAKLMCFFSMVDVRKNMHNDVMQQLYKDKRFFEYYIPYTSGVEKMGLHHAPVEAFAPSSYASVCYRALWREIKEGVL